ncbi:MAG: hypothetical protein JXB60_06510, partial [Candidatus Cloacimonetes bacterium]|nr:hypothetical protein [Candidatus Cloacimonadota bacterium]
MKKCIIIATVMLLLLCAVSEAVLIWDQVYGGTASEGGRDVIEAIDGGFVIVGFTYSEGNGNSDVYLVKTDTQGNQIWTQTYGGSGWEFGYSLCAAEDGSGYVIAGYTTSSGNGLRDVFLVGTDIAGNQLWTQTYGGADLDEASSIITGHEGGYVVCGYTCSYGAGEDDIYVIGTDNGGNYIWSAVLGTEKSEMGKTIRKTGDGNYIIAGSTGLYDTPGVNSGKSRE